VPYIERHWLKRGDVNRKNKMILNKIKNQNIKIQIISEEKIEKPERVSQNVNTLEKLDENLREAAEIKYWWKKQERKIFAISIQS